MLLLSFQRFNNLLDQKALGFCYLFSSNRFLEIFNYVTDWLKYLILTCSSRFNSFSYLYNVDHFIEALKNDVIVVKSLPTKLKEDRGKGKIETIQPQISASPRFYISKVLPKLEKAEVIGLIITDGGCLQVCCYYLEHLLK